MTTRPLDVAKLAYPTCLANLAKLTHDLDAKRTLERKDLLLIEEAPTMLEMLPILGWLGWVVP